MMPIFFILFVAMPIIELLVLLEVGSEIGGWNTVGLVLLTAVVGTWLLRREGLATLTSLQHKMQQGQMPVNDIAAGVAIAAGGALLLTPGFITDVIGFALVLPGSRMALGRYLVSKLAHSPNVHFSGFSHMGSARPEQQNNNADSIIEGDFEEKHEN